MSGYLLKTFRAQEIARERNKREDRKLNLNLSGKNGPEAVYKFNMDKVNKEQKVIARELGKIRTMGPPRATGDLHKLSKEQSIAERNLEKIRQGIHKPTNKNLLTPDKKFHHPVFNFTDIPEHESTTNATLKDKAKWKENINSSSIADLKRPSIDSEDSVVDGFMIIKYLGDLHSNTQKLDRTPPSSERNTKAPVHRSPVNHNQQIDIDTPSLAFKRSNEIGKIDSNHAEPSHSDLAQHSTEKEIIESVSTGDARSGTARVGVVTDRPARVPQENGQAPTRHKKDFTSSASLLVPETSLRSSSQPDLERKPTLDLATLASVDMSNVRNKVSTRLTKDHTNQTSALSDPGSSRRQNNRKGTVSAGVDVSYAAEPQLSNTNNDAASIDDAPRPRIERRLSKQQMDELLRKPVYDPERYNPDGSLKTMHTLPDPDKSWEEAKKARYIRSKEALERDRELTTKEIFSNH